MTSAFKSILWLPNRCAIRFRGQSLTGVSLDQGCLLKSASGERIGPADKEWDVAGPILPPEQGRGHRPAQDNCPYFECMMWIARTGAQSRHVPDEYGKWNSVFRRYRPWGTTGVFDAMLETLAELAGQDTAADTIDRTVVRAHDCAVSKKGTQQIEALGRSRGGFTTKLHARCDARGLPLGFALTPGQAHDVRTLLRCSA